MGRPEQVAKRRAELILGGRPESAEAALALGWRQWSTFCAVRGKPVLMIGRTGEGAREEEDRLIA